MRPRHPVGLASRSLRADAGKVLGIGSVSRVHRAIRRRLPAVSCGLLAPIGVLALGGAFALGGALAVVDSPPAAAAAAAAARKPAAKLTAANWDPSAQGLVVTQGIMAAEGSAGFGGAGGVSIGEDDAALAALAAREGVAPVDAPGDAPLSVVGFDALLVDQLGLGEVAAHVQQVAAAAGLQPPAYFGSEVLARYLGLRYEHPVGQQALDLYPWNTITRSEAAYSFATVLEAGSWALAAAREAFAAFSLPAYTAAQLQALRIAVAKIGMPYVWGGTTDNTADGLEHGGYDCSGFAWRVYKVSGLSWGRQIRGRTAAEQAGEIPRSARLRLAEVQPGDLLFFGSAGFEARATNANIIHEGIALSSQWAIHSSAQGVYVLPLTSGWLAEQFAWARRVL
ncbi:MAG TPA: NlpC/P60 family protein [Solirubrobacteraceae bacterium]|nr:NlpC/P60 family protein [Solirubrobacteraceae bacterium]